MKLRTIRLVLVSLVALWVLAPSAGAEATPDEEPLQPLIESHYKIAPGKTDEWLHRYTTQHLPILKELQREGRILQITILRPALHQGGPEWHFKVILRFRDFAALGDSAHEEAVERRLFPDWEQHKEDERRRWEITLRHWDDLMVEVPTD
ncbi:MAG: hypothetical protein IH789_07680 [Acidobacteria bacterium]|nr:hypothetical protein [Acidobacteriota bacterium]